MCDTIFQASSDSYMQAADTKCKEFESVIETLKQSSEQLKADLQSLESQSAAKLAEAILAHQTDSEAAKVLRDLLQIGLGEPLATPKLAKMFPIYFFKMEPVYLTM